ncbi:hypothetical protein [Psychrobacter sp. ENNN9_III]|uniref:hypothetical protein n=1 Tax=Psychrobacter sp. ENNN9_III TaxID=1254334 RepID=UPI000AB1059E|nr:hypothetical protein [Psychrobacter sp. ENNN9_III]
MSGHESVSYFQVRAIVCLADDGTFCGLGYNVAAKFEFGTHYRNQYELIAPKLSEPERRP